MEVLAPGKDIVCISPEVSLHVEVMVVGIGILGDLSQFTERT
jgi:hypothetical protein